MSEEESCETARQTSRSWMALHPEYEPSRDVAEKMYHIIVGNGWKWEIENLEKAWNILTENHLSAFLGRWETRTEQDCIFLRQCGIDPEEN